MSFAFFKEKKKKGDCIPSARILKARYQDQLNLRLSCTHHKLK